VYHVGAPEFISVFLGVRIIRFQFYVLCYIMTIALAVFSSDLPLLIYPFRIVKRFLFFKSQYELINI